MRPTTPGLWTHSAGRADPNSLEEARPLSSLGTAGSSPRQQALDVAVQNLLAFVRRQERVLHPRDDGRRLIDGEIGPVEYPVGADLLDRAFENPHPFDS